MSITTSLMQKSDIAQILTIQDANLRGKLSPEQLKDGYLSIAFSKNEFNAFNNDTGVVVAKERGQVIAYCCVSSAAYNIQFPILDQIVVNLANYSVPGVEQQASTATTCFYGPACIDSPFRGQNVLPLLFSHAAAISKDAGYSFCFSFVSSENQRSLKAHLKLPLNKVGRVTYNDREFIVIACKL